MKELVINTLLWFAVKTMKVGHWFFMLALRLEVGNKIAKKAEAEAEEPLDEEEPLYAAVEEDELEEQEPIAFTGEDGKAIPLSTEDELPEFEVFSAMFERKYGKWGRMPMSISGQQRTYDVHETYLLLSKIKGEKKPSSMMLAVYGSVLSVVMKAHGETIESKNLN